MSDWKLGPDGKTLIYIGAGGAPLLSGQQQVAMRNTLGNTPTAAAPMPTAAPKPAGGMIPNPTPGTVITQGTPKVPTSVPATGNPGLAFNQSHANLATSAGLSVGPNGAIIAPSGYTGQSGDTTVQMADGSKTILAKNGLVITVPGQIEAGDMGGEGGGGGGSKKKKSSGTGDFPATKVNGPQTAKDLLPAFSPPAINQFPNFYDPGAYAPVAGSSDIPAGYTGPTVPDMGGQSKIANIFGNPWSAKTLNLTPGQNGYGMPAGNDLNNNYVDPRVYGYIAPVMNPAMFQGARSSSK